MAPLGAALRGEVVETLVAVAQSQVNAERVLSVDSWQQYLLSVVSSAQGRQAVSAAAAAGGGAAGGTTATAASFRGEDEEEQGDPQTPEWRPPSRGYGAADDGGPAAWQDRRTAREEAAREGRLVDRTVKLICWLAMCKARSGMPGRPGAGFAELRDTMAFLRCQGELGTMECMSVGESMLRHMVRERASVCVIGLSTSVFCV